ncbi:DUF397 domain-containing protein [Labedaea rhizosphaerae]|uniref:Uncharacterized protein DUF397 n=1 Tax=Labedaea rhizosphaerae TaxID=598644 RepID=A0A4R6SMR3_LABRH|nr:DUF397 domain-containing protein [Labedaea rhizosphaerae]TDQ04860.1 uncharacterized protein DUF397 [Labedaea rhizosphaerae]
MISPDISRAVWRKSSRSSDNGGQCVEVAKVDGWAAIRDSKNQDGPVIVVSRHEWLAFRAALAAGRDDSI